MFKNYLTIAFRNLLRFKSYTLINILGLSIGMSCCILIILFIKDELSYDRFHTNSDRIYRIVQMNSPNGKSYLSGTPAPLATALLNELPGNIQVTRFGNGQGNIITYGDIQTKGNRFRLADPNVFEIFTIPLIKGSPKNALNELNSIVISENLAQRYFGDEDPMGQILQIGKETYHQDYKVTGVFSDLPTNSSLKFDCLASFQHAYVKGNEGNLTWGVSNYNTFIMLQDNYTPQSLEVKLPRIVEKYKPSSGDSRTEYFLQPLTGIHLNLDPGSKFPTERNSVYIFIFTGVALLILLIACINFMNLATARASMREKEVGVRKVVGALRIHLVKQFLGESIILSLLAFILSAPIVEVLLPAFNQYAGKELVFLHYDNILFLASLFIIAIIVGTIAGSDPALFISSFKPVSILRGRLFEGRANTKTGLRKILVVSQFVISIIFITCTLIMHNQLHYIKTKNLGYNKDHLIVVPIFDQHIKPKYELYKTEVLRNSNILSATATSYLPSERGYHQNVSFEGTAKGAMSHINWIPVDYDFIETMELELTMGRNFSQGYLLGKGITYILNESAIKQIGWENPLGKRMNIVDWGPVIGVIKDFHYKSLRHQIKPMALCIFPGSFQHLIVRVKPENISNSIRFMENQWEKVFPNQVFEYNFFDEDFDKLYKTEIRLGNIFNFITALALFVACLGLFGLVHFSTERRTKEIGIRKVAGATILNIVALLTQNFIKWVLIANLIAFPIAYYAMNKWLQDYAYKIEISWWIFVLAGGIVLLIALATVSYQAIKAAMANPVEALKYE